MKRISSILDYQQDQLCPEIWDKDGNIKKGVEKYVYSAFEAFFDMEGLIGVSSFARDILIASSLATYLYTEETDFDVKMVVDIDKLRKYNKELEFTNDEDILEHLIDSARGNVWLTSTIPGTYHELDPYFYSTKEQNSLNMLKYDSLYSVREKKWYKEPKKLPKSLSPAYVLERAKDKAKPYIEKLTLDIAQAKRDTMDFFILADYLKTIDTQDLYRFQKYLERSLEEVNSSIALLLEDREIVKKLRKKAFNKIELTSELEQLMKSLNFSDENIVYKLLQRYGYLRILTAVMQIYKDRQVSIDELAELSDILKSASNRGKDDKLEENIFNI